MALAIELSRVEEQHMIDGGDGGPALPHAMDHTPAKEARIVTGLTATEAIRGRVSSSPPSHEHDLCRRMNKVHFLRSVQCQFANGDGR